jgi:hypothetical protein
MSNQVLNGHTNFNNAYIIEDYPYGFNSRCKKKVWIETATKGAKKGMMRVMTCTSNPKTGGWNKPKSEGYDILTVLFINEDGHVKSASLNEYSGVEDCEAFLSFYGIIEVSCHLTNYA